MKKIMVVGAGRLQAKTIKLVKELGYYCICVDKNPEAEGFEFADDYRVMDVLDTTACLNYAKENKIDGVTTTSAIVTLPTVATIAREMGLVGINPEVVEVLQNKYRIKKRLFEAGLHNAGYFADLSTPSLLAEAKKSIQYPSIVKPVDGSGSKGITVVNRPEDLSAALENALSSSNIKGAYIERFIDGTEYGAESFVFDGEVQVFGVMGKRMTSPPDYVELGHCLPAGLPAEIEEEINAEVKRAIRCLGINHGSVNMDIILSKDNVPYIVDIGARIGLNQIAERIIPFATGVDILTNTVRACVGDEASFKPLYKRPVASRLLNFEPGVIGRIGDYKSLINGEDVLDIIITVKPGDTIRPYKINSDTCGWVITTAATVEEAALIADRVRDEIKALFE